MSQNEGLREKLHLAVVISILGVWSSGCSSGGGDKISFKLPETTRYVPAEGETSVLRVDNEQATIVLDPSSRLAGRVVKGDVLLLGITRQTPEGLLRRVAAVSTTGEGVSVDTEEATMEEAFEELDLEVEDHPLPYEEMASYDTALQGLTVRRAPLTIGGSRTSSFEIGFDGTVLYDHDGNKSTTNDQVVADGSISFSLSFQLKAKIGWFKLKYLKAGAAVRQDGNLTIRSTLIGPSFQKEVVLGKMNFASFSIGPVVVTPQLEFILGAMGELKVEVVTSLSEHVGAEAGAIYQNGHWTAYSSKDQGWEFQPPTLTASAQLKAYIGPRVNLKLYGVAGPYAQVTGYLDLVADVSQTPWWELYAGIEGAMGIQGKILGFKLFQFQLDHLVDFRVLLAQAEDPPCVPNCAGRVCGLETVCNSSCGTCVGNSFCENGQCVPAGETWTDTVNSLTWEVIGAEVNAMDFTAVTHCQNLTKAGGGWRLPSIGELRTLVRGCAVTQAGGTCEVTDACKLPSCYAAAACDGCVSGGGGATGGCYWPAELLGACDKPYTSNTSYPYWAIDFKVASIKDVGNGITAYARCVR